jgi:DNA polymerase III epsilon subunit-like protein
MSTELQPDREPGEPAEGLFDDRDWTRLQWAVVDVEGNGQQPDPDLVEVAVVHIVGGQIGAGRSWLVRPPRPVTWQARRVHGLTSADLDGERPAESVEAEVLAYLEGADAVVGHQVRVDLAVLTRSFPGWPALPAVDTLRLARTLHPDLPSHRLGALAQHFQLTTGLPGPAHRAGYDATIAARLLVHLATGLAPETAKQLIDASTSRSASTTSRDAAAPRAAGTSAVPEEAAATLFEVP